MKKWAGKLIQSLGYELVKIGKQRIPPDFDRLHLDIYEKVKGNTMTSPERIFALIEAVRYCDKNRITGAFVECGVWKGGSMMAVAETLMRAGDESRDLYLYDTFEGMSEPGENDETWYGESAGNLLKRDEDRRQNPFWAYSALETVQEGMSRTRYPEEKVHFVQGKVEDTIPGVKPGEIALLRLDTDWYESELEYLYPLLKKGGVLILDDYGHWQGARKAVDEYFEQHRQPMLLNRIDETGRIAIKQI